MKLGSIVDRIRVLAQTARKDGHEVYTKELFQIADEMTAYGETASYDEIQKIQMEDTLGVEHPDQIERSTDILGRVLDVMRVRRVILERDSSTPTLTVEQGDGNSKEEGP